MDFGRDLKAAVPMVKRSRPRMDTDRLYVYVSIGLRDPSAEGTALVLGPPGPEGPGPSGPRS